VDDDELARPEVQGVVEVAGHQEHDSPAVPGAAARAHRRLTRSSLCSRRSILRAGPELGFAGPLSRDRVVEASSPYDRSALQGVSAARSPRSAMMTSVRGTGTKMKYPRRSAGDARNERNSGSSRKRESARSRPLRTMTSIPFVATKLQNGAFLSQCGTYVKS